MEPFISSGDVISIAPLRSKAIAVGDVVACFSEATAVLVVHRVVAMNGHACLLRGDSVPDGNDGWAPLTDVLGCVVKVERQGRVVRFGLGREKCLIALLSRASLLLPVQRAVLPLSRPLRRILG